MRKVLVVLLALCILSCKAPVTPVQTSLRIATFNVAAGLRNAGELQQKLRSGEDENLKKVAAIIQEVRPDVLMLNEFDYEAGTQSGRLFNKNYLNVSQFGRQAINYPWGYSGPSNTGDQSGLDLDLNGALGDPADSWGFGFFPGQFAMQLLSAYPLDTGSIRNFRHLLWRSMPGAKLPVHPDTSEAWYPEETANQLRLSSKDHWDIPLLVNGQTLHILAFHPTPPVFDGPEDRNGLRNHDEIRLFADYISPDHSAYIVDDNGQTGGLAADAKFVILGDMNADPHDGDSSGQPILQLLDHPRINTSCLPGSKGAQQASLDQGGLNLENQGDPNLDTSDFNDEFVGNLRLDYIFPSATIKMLKCRVFWPAPDQPGADWIEVSDHRLVWADIQF